MEVRIEDFNRLLQRVEVLEETLTRKHINDANLSDMENVILNNTYKIPRLEAFVDSFEEDNDLYVQHDSGMSAGPL